MEKQEVKVGMNIIFMNEVRQELSALVTAVHGETVYNDDGSIQYAPCVNIVFVSQTQTKQDVHGTQIERHSSVQHRSSNAYHESATGNPIGMTWQFMNEVYK